VVTLGIETSCDETACGIVDDRLRVLANAVYSQIDLHAVYGGVVPEIAARAHLEKIGPIVRSALAEASLDLSQVDQIAFTRGPGLLGPLLVGASFARALARDLGKPAVGVNHLEGHLASAFLEAPDLEPPFLCLVVSGGHSEFVKVDPGLAYTAKPGTTPPARPSTNAENCWDSAIRPARMSPVSPPGGGAISSLSRAPWIRRTISSFPSAASRRRCCGIRNRPIRKPCETNCPIFALPWNRLSWTYWSRRPRRRWNGPPAALLRW
jgi:glycoprotease/Kae1 family metallohydrolase